MPKSKQIIMFEHKVLRPQPWKQLIPQVQALFPSMGGNLTGIPEIPQFETKHVVHLS